MALEYASKLAGRTYVDVDLVDMQSPNTGPALAWP